MIWERSVIIFFLFLAVSNETVRWFISIAVSGLVMVNSKSLPKPEGSIEMGVLQDRLVPKILGTRVQETDILLAFSETVIGWVFLRRKSR